jgi:hypothetical protein
MNLEKTINKNMFNMSSAIHSANPLAPPTRMKSDQQEQPDSPTISTPLSSILANPKQKLTTQFKRAITAIKQRSDVPNDLPSASSTPPPQILTNEKSSDSTILTRLIDEPNKQNDNILPPTKSQSFIHVKSQSTHQIDTNNPPSATILTIDPPQIRTTNPNSPSSRIVKQSLQQIHSSIIQTMSQHHPVSPTTSSSATLSPTPTSSSTMGTGEVAILETIL